MSSFERLSTDLDKAWHGIHYLLTGTDAVEGEFPRATFSWQVVRQWRERYAGYGPARALMSTEDASRP